MMATLIGLQSYYDFPQSLSPHILSVVFPPAIVSILNNPPFTRFISSHNYSTTTPLFPTDCRCAPPVGFMFVGGLAVQSSQKLTNSVP